ncbi:pyrroloquinoline quinone biosynthesis protein PqqB [Chromatiales bacterium (ex Bugula neritina AB1)]|nr:pyrroloquinoline quinone biosynthesis protein PqqB [Chromatiales bacterium (ex Bugula neritina AB1)]
MKILVLGSAAGGGYPQWNCNCETCSGVRTGRIQSIPRTQSSIAVSSDGLNWLLVNASPDIGQQLREQPLLQPARSLRDTGITAVMLMDSQIDHTTGLLSLREHNTRLPLYCTQMVHNDLTSGFPVLNMLEHYCGVDWHKIEIDESWFTVPGIEGLEFKPLVIDSKAPPYSPHRHDPHPGDNIAITIRDSGTGKSVFYSPGLGGLQQKTRDVMHSVDCLLVDGTTWTNDEMQTRGVGSKLASEMGHLAQSGPGGMIEEIKDLSCRKILIHINNTNPILDPNSQQAKTLAAEDIEIAEDGMQIDL